MKGKGDKKTYILQRDETINKKYRRSTIGAGNLNKNYQLLVRQTVPQQGQLKTGQNSETPTIQIKSAFLDDEDEKDAAEPAQGSGEQVGFLESRREIADVESMIEDETEEYQSDSEDPADNKSLPAQGSSGQNQTAGKGKDQKKSSNKENDMLKLRNVKINVMRPFYDENFKDFYLKQMVLKNLDKIFVAAISLLLSITINLITNFIYEDQESNLWASRILEIVCILGLALFIALYNSDIMVQSPLITKVYLGVIIVVSMVSRLVEIYYLHINEMEDIK